MAERDCSWLPWALALWLVLLSTASAGLLDDVREALAGGGDPNGWVPMEVGGRTHPLHIVAAAEVPEAEQLKAIRLLLEAGAYIDGRDDQGNTPLHRAVSSLRAEAVKLLLKKGADPNARNQNGDTPLHALQGAASLLKWRPPPPAERERRVASMRAIVRSLIDRGARVDFRNRQGRTPLNHLAADAPATVLEPLLAAGADASLADDKGETPLSRAMASSADTAVVSLLLRHGAKATAEVLVHATNAAGEVEQAIALVQASGLANTATENGELPLVAAVVRARSSSRRKEYLRLVSVLMEAGADPRKKATGGLFAGSSAIDLARGDEEILALLQKGSHAAKTSDEPKSSSPVDSGIEAAIDHLGSLMATVDELEDPAKAAGDIDTLANAQAIPGRMETLERYARASRRLARFIQEGATLAQRKAREAGATSEEAERAARSIRKTFSSPLQRALHDRSVANAEWAEANIEAYRLLQKNRGKWALSGQGKRLRINDRVLGEALSRLSRRMTDAGRRAGAAQRRLEAALED